MEFKNLQVVRLAEKFMMLDGRQAQHVLLPCSKLQKNLDELIPGLLLTPRSNFDSVGLPPIAALSASFISAQLHKLLSLYNATMVILAKVFN